MTFKIDIEIKGETPLLMHSTQAMLDAPKSTKNMTKSYDHKEEAEKVTYRNKEGQLIVPSRCLKSCIINSASWFKFGKNSAKAILAGMTRIEPIELILNKQEYEIDLRPVVIQKQRIIRARPKIEDWKLSFTLICHDNLKTGIDVIKEIVKESGERIGLLDNRPQKYGENGCFSITKFEVQE